MSDARLAALRRAWEASGSVEDQAAYLLARLRAGELTQARLVAAADLGSEAARLSLQREGGVTSLCDALLALSPSERVGYACDCAARVLELWEAAHPEDRRPRALLEGVRGWLAGEDDPAGLEALAQAVWSCQNPHEIDPPTRAARALYWIGEAVGEDDEAQVESLAEAIKGSVHALAEAVWEDAYASDELVADLKQAHAANVERRWQRSRLCQMLLG